MIRYTESDKSAAHLIYRVGRLLRYRAARFFMENEIDISPEQWMLLVRIGELQPTAISDLADSVINDHPNITRLTYGLEKKGFVERTRNPEDRRSSLLSLTPDGEAFIRRVYPDLSEEKDSLFAGLDRSDVATLVKTLKVIELHLAE